MPHGCGNRIIFSQKLTQSPCLCRTFYNNQILHLMSFFCQSSVISCQLLPSTLHHFYHACQDPLLAQKFPKNDNLPCLKAAKPDYLINNLGEIIKIIEDLTW